MWLALVQIYRPLTFDLTVTAWLLLGLGWLGGLAAVLTGLLAQTNLPPAAPYRAVLNWHIGAALAQLVVYGFLLYCGWLYGTPRHRKQRLAAGNQAPDLLADPSARRWVTGVLVVGMLLVFAAGWNGGALVYEWGVNVSG